MHFEQTADSDTVSAHQVSSMQSETDSIIFLAVVRRSAPATTSAHSRVIRLRRVLTDHPLQWTQY